jgi:hypothetical protein
MKTRKPGIPSRRGFLARLAAVGTMLGGVVPELRAGTLMETPIAPPPATPLPPAASALLYSSALADAEVKMLLASAGPGASVMPPEHTYDMGSQGQGISLPVKNSSGIVTAFVFYGSSGVPGASLQTSSPVIKLLLKDNGTALVALNASIYPTPPGAAEQVEILYASFFTDKFVEKQTTAELDRQAVTRAQQGQQPMPGAPNAVAACNKRFADCIQALVKNKGLLVYFSLISCIFCKVAAANFGGGLAFMCIAPCSHVANNINNWNVRILVCITKFKKCISLINEPKFLV